MSIKNITLNLPPDFTQDDLKEQIGNEVSSAKFAYRVIKQSFDSRKRDRLHWQLRVAVADDEKSLNEGLAVPTLNIPHKKRTKKAVVCGSGPAGFFSALVLRKAGFETTIIERGSDVEKRTEGIAEFERTAEFNPASNYAFGEGGAGTFSDGKLTSRSKRISLERDFIISSYIDAGAPAEIASLAHPHIGSNNLRKIVKNLREEYIQLGGKILFETTVTDLKIEKGSVKEVVTDKETLETDYFIMAPGLAAYDTYRMLMNNGVLFKPKSFAIGHRVEHEQSMINRAQWGVESLSGVKAAEYRLTAKETGDFPVYSFCMCPGGIVVPSTAFENNNIVNGMSFYERSGQFASAGVVAGIHPDDLLGRKASAMEAIEALEEIEQNFFFATENYKAPFCGIRDYIKQRMPEEIPETSYPLGLEPYALWNLLPRPISKSLRKGLQNFGRKINGFTKGIIMGLESKTSSPIQVVRNRDSLLADGFDNLFVVGEGSGWAGGIMTSAADGIKAAMKIVEAE